MRTGGGLFANHGWRICYLGSAFLHGQSCLSGTGGVTSQRPPAMRRGSSVRVALGRVSPVVPLPRHMPSASLFRPEYENSWALVIGINAYTKAPPLQYARNDAQAVVACLCERHGFANENVTLLVDAAATRDAVLSAFLSFTRDHVNPDDRLLVFFAGHGLTRPGRRQDVGYLVPVDGDPGDISTLVRWDELTRNADLVRAKHVLFVMDACYGGLAVTRSAPAGLRFLKDMLQRYARQVLAAGKPDETVADAGGPRSGHSIFTGHLLDALDGAAAGSDGTITANGVMGYVYERVSKHPDSRQTPHYGCLDGDGDFVFVAPPLSALLIDPTVDRDVLIEAPSAGPSSVGAAGRAALLDVVKDYLSESRFRIRFDDLVMREVQTILQATHRDRIPMDTPIQTPADIGQRLQDYEHAVERLACMLILTARWGTAEHRALLARATSRIVESIDVQGGQTLWLGLRWYPAEYILYASGVAALNGGNYDNLAALFTSRVRPATTGGSDTSVIEAVVGGIIDATRAEAFKWLPGHEKQYTPRSEYVFKTLQPLLEDLLYLGRAYEDLFDRYEVFVALVHADLESAAGRRFWGPPGRFAWKVSRDDGDDPLQRVIREARDVGNDWAPLRAGLFGGSSLRFLEVAEQYRGLIVKLGWH
jgi:Caspase domain